MKKEFNIFINITLSKIMAFLILGSALILDLKNGGATAFMFVVPFISALVLGKQYLDRNKTYNEDKNE
jgi:hypothetical protein